MQRVVRSGASAVTDISAAVSASSMHGYHEGVTGLHRLVDDGSGEVRSQVVGTGELVAPTLGSGGEDAAAVGRAGRIS